MKTLWILLAMLLSWPTAAALLDDMVELDRSYVPVLALTNQAGAQAESWAAMKRFDAAWAKFRTGPAIARERSLQTTLDGAERHLAEARASIDAGKLKDAHEALEHIRHAFAAWRSARGIAYFPDVLTAWHDEMEWVTDQAMKAGPPEALADALNLLRSHWNAVEGIPLDARLHAFDVAKMDNFRTLMARERDALSELERSRAASDAGAMAQAAKLVRGTFARIFFLFGDFTRLNGVGARESMRSAGDRVLTYRRVSTVAAFVRYAPTPCPDRFRAA